MSREQDFGQRPLIAGSFTGIRSWRVDPAGVLTGVHAQEPWAIVGENVARCTGPLATLQVAMDAFNRAFAASGALTAWQMGKLVAALNGTVYLRKRLKLEPPPVRPQTGSHAAGSLTCNCGFYAYFDLAHNPHHLAGNVLGLVEGYGTMTIGERGFRASKARVVALIEPVPASVRDIHDTLPPIFSTIEAALAEFPLSVPPAVEHPPMPTEQCRWGRVHRA